MPAQTLAQALEGGRLWQPRMKIVRINGLDTEWGREDAAAAADGLRRDSAAQGELRLRI